MKAVRYTKRPPVETTSADVAVYVPRRFSVEEYERMEEAGILTEEDRVELIDGSIVIREPGNPPHSGRIIRLTHCLTELLRGRALVSVQNDLRINRFNQPLPDLAVLRSRDDYYEISHPNPEDVYLVIEVGLTTVRADQRIKVPLYARAGIRELWIVNIPEHLIEVYREPSHEGYRRIVKLGPGARLSIDAFPDATLDVGEITGLGG